VPLKNKDSLAMTEQDRVLILGMVRAILKENAPIVVTPSANAVRSIQERQQIRTAPSLSA
jgi:hypothetical protein